MKRRITVVSLALVAGLLLAAPTIAQTFVSGDVTQDTTFSGQVVLQGAVFVRAGVTLTIEPGTEIFGEQATLGTLIIDRGARILAEGTIGRPIVMSSDQVIGERTRAGWGGLIINGFAPTNNGVQEGEGDTGLFGGDNPNDNSGILRYVRVEFAGAEFSPENELNGIAFQGVGNLTLVEFIQVHFNLDDGIEMFGGTVNFKYALTTGIGDDNIDWTDGWTGKAQFIVAQQRGDDADQGIEADNNAENNNKKPRSAPQIYNITLIGDPDANEGDESDIGILLREGTAGELCNIIVIGFKETGLEIDDQATFVEVRRGNLTIRSAIFFDNPPANGGQRANFSDDADEEPAPFLTTAQLAAGEGGFWSDIFTVDPRIRRPYNLTNPNFRPRRKSPAVDGTVPVTLPPADGFFSVVDFIGAMGPRPRDDWTRRWTTSAQS